MRRVGSVRTAMFGVPEVGCVRIITKEPAVSTPSRRSAEPGPASPGAIQPNFAAGQPLPVGDGTPSADAGPGASSGTGTPGTGTTGTITTDTVKTGTVKTGTVTPDTITTDTVKTDTVTTDTVTPGMRIAADWSWRLLVVVAAAAVVYYGVSYLSEITIPIVIALLLSALLSPVRRLLVRHGWKPNLAAIGVFVGGLLVVAGIITLVIRQFVSGAADLADRVSTGLDKVQQWLVTGPLKLSHTEITSATDTIKKTVIANKDSFTSGALSTASSVGRILTGLVLVLFILFFFLRDGEKIWRWIVRLAPTRARSKIAGAADRAWATLTGYVRATVAVAFVDAVGIGLGLVVLGVPLFVPLTAFVFLSSFIPIVGALASGIVAVLVALVTVGLVKAIIVLAVVIAVQQLEAHVLQPVLLGRAVNLHPLAVAVSIATGVIVGGIVGALLAVPTAACVNAAGRYLAGRGDSIADSEASGEATGRE